MRKPIQNLAPWIKTHGLAAPYGECQCGCGLVVSLAKRADARQSVRKNDYVRYMVGHNRRKWVAEDKANA